MSNASLFCMLFELSHFLKNIKKVSLLSHSLPNRGNHYLCNVFFGWQKIDLILFVAVPTPDIFSCISLMR